MKKKSAKKYKPGTILMVITGNSSRLYFLKYAYNSQEDASFEGWWEKVPAGSTVMVLSTPQILESENPESYYYELLAGDKHAQHYRSTIENRMIWKAVSHGEEEDV